MERTPSEQQSSILRDELPPELVERLRQVEIEADAAAGKEHISRSELGKYAGCGTFFFAMLAVPVVFLQLMMSESPPSLSGMVLTVLICGITGGILTGAVAACRPRREQ